MKLTTTGQTSGKATLLDGLLPLSWTEALSYAAELSKVVAESTGETVKKCEPILGRGISNNVVVVSTTGGQFVLRLNKIEHAPFYQKEAWCLEQAHSLGIPVPRVLAHGCSTNFAYSIARFIDDAIPARDLADATPVWKALGHYARLLNGIKVEGLGDIMTAPGKFSLTRDEVVSGELRVLFQDPTLWRERLGWSSRKITAAFNCINSLRRSELALGLCNFDIGPGNSMVRGFASPEIIIHDLDMACAAPVPHFQLACVAQSQGLRSSATKAFVEGYGNDGIDESLQRELDPFVLMRHMRSIRWAETKGRDDYRAAYVKGLETFLEERKLLS